jgi:two-component system sensor histidine kinase RpfC
MDLLNKSSNQNVPARNLKILVAEDNTTNQLVITKILERAGYSAHIVNNGQEALDELEVNTYDLIILDMQMPIMGGIEAAKIYNYSTSTEKNAPIIILTADATTQAIRECEDARVNAYLTKPIDIKKLLKTIENLSNGSIESETDRCYGMSHNAKNYVERPSTHLIDKCVLESLNDLSTDEAFIENLITGYICDSRQLISQMESTVARKDYHRFSELVHALKGSSGSIGAIELYKLCSEARLSNDADIIRLLKAITSTFSDTSDELSFIITDERFVRSKAHGSSNL